MYQKIFFISALLASFTASAQPKEITIVNNTESNVRCSIENPERTKVEAFSLLPNEFKKTTPKNKLNILVCNSDYMGLKKEKTFDTYALIDEAGFYDLRLSMHKCNLCENGWVYAVVVTKPSGGFYINGLMSIMQ
ncbi:hypothetical protein [Oceanobacter mangrovi]|uniref:hypothetical protein n=1 Tax=Oceanobacter mangrovi TaxID=2862510 RepID=UPI001C8EA1AF|nr:hypothetical protein [Oceanobacter mangrovi]